MEKSVQELAEFLKGTVEHDNPELRITGVNGLVEAGPKDISFAVPPHVEHCHLSKAGVMVLSSEDPDALLSELPTRVQPLPHCWSCSVRRKRLSVLSVLMLMYPRRQRLAAMLLFSPLLLLRMMPKSATAA